MPMEYATLYGSPHSLYTGRARSYLIKAGITYREVAPNTQHYRNHVVPLAGGRRGMPTLELPDGSVIRDGAAIIDYYEARNDHAFTPATPQQNFFSLLFDVFGAEGLLRPAMHYRWNFDAENLPFLNFHFRALMPPGDRGDELAAAAQAQMRGAAKAFGVTEETFGLIEELYADVLAALDAHFAVSPYLFGGKPSIGDFGLLAPLYGHLCRDPKPLSLMQTNAIHVFRWVERMNRPEPDLSEFDQYTANYAPNDAIPETLINLLAVLATDFVPETRAAAQTINSWLAENQALPSGTETARGVGFANFTVRGQSLSALAQPYRFYLLARLQAAYANLPDHSRTSVDAILAQTNLTPLLTARLDRNIGRANNLEVWL